MKKNLSRVLLLLLAAALICLTACNKAGTQKKTEAEQKPGTLTESGAENPADPIEGTVPLPAVTKVAIKNIYGKLQIKFTYSEEDLSSIDVMFIDLLNKYTGEWVRLNGYKPDSGYTGIDFFADSKIFGNFTKIRCTCAAKAGSGYTDSVYEQDLSIKISSRTALSDEVTVRYAKKDDGSYGVTVNGLESGARALVHTYSGMGYEDPESQQLMAALTGRGPSFSCENAETITEREAMIPTGYYRVWVYEEKYDSASSLSVSFTDLTGWCPIDLQ